MGKVTVMACSRVSGLPTTTKASSPATQLMWRPVLQYDVDTFHVKSASLVKNWGCSLRKVMSWA